MREGWKGERRKEEEEKERMDEFRLDFYFCSNCFYMFSPRIKDEPVRITNRNLNKFNQKYNADIKILHSWLLIKPKII